MINRYANNGILGNVQTMEANAQKLEDFFKKLKSDAKNWSIDNPVESAINQQILEDIQTISNTGTKVSKLFRRSKGLDFEKEMSKVIYSILSQVSDEKVSKNNQLLDIIHVGSKKANIEKNKIDLNELFLNPSVQRILEQTQVKTKKYLSDQAKNNKMLSYYLTDVEGKVDVQGAEVQIRGNPSSELLEIYHLLKDATFSAKNYGDLYWDRKIHSFNYSSDLILGNTNVFRAFYSVLRDLKYNQSTIISAFWSSWYGAEKNPNIALRINQIRFVYELTGAGLKYNQDLINGHVKYLIYNAPDSDDIYVRSTAKIINDLLKTNALGFENPFSRKITISKSYFHN